MTKSMKNPCCSSKLIRVWKLDKPGFQKKGSQLHERKRTDNYHNNNPDATHRHSPMEGVNAELGTLPLLCLEVWEMVFQEKILRGMNKKDVKRRWSVGKSQQLVSQVSVNVMPEINA